jgi:hypothetical protein
MNAQDQRDRYCVPALERGIGIFELLGQRPTPLSGADIARELRIPRATVFRLLRTLEHREWLRRTEGGTYSLGPAVLHLEFLAESARGVAGVGGGDRRGLGELTRDDLYPASTPSPTPIL